MNAATSKMLEMVVKQDDPGFTTADLRLGGSVERGTMDIFLELVAASDGRPENGLAELGFGDGVLRNASESEMSKPFPGGLLGIKFDTIVIDGDL